MTNTELDTTTEQEAPEKVKPHRPHRLVPFEHTVEQVSLVEKQKAPDTTSTTLEEDNHDEGVVFEPISQQPYIISYVCVMIPRFPSHVLAGDVVDRLFEWMEQIAISYSWKLEWLDIQNGHMQWLLSVPVAVPPGHFLRIIRHHTSARIFAEFPRYKKENLSNDFWAPGQMIMVGKRPHPQQKIDDFTRLTRLQQGITPRPRR
jgi:REP element-mobilizing transposase RayT